MVNTRNEMNLEYYPNKITMDKGYYFLKKFGEIFIKKANFSKGMS